MYDNVSLKHSPTTKTKPSKNWSPNSKAKPSRVKKSTNAEQFYLHLKHTSSKITKKTSPSFWTISKCMTGMMMEYFRMMRLIDVSALLFRSMQTCYTFTSQKKIWKVCSRRSWEKEEKRVTWSAWRSRSLLPSWETAFDIYMLFK